MYELGISYVICIVVIHGDKIIRRMGIGIWEGVFDIYIHPLDETIPLYLVH